MLSHQSKFYTKLNLVSINAHCRPSIGYNRDQTRMLGLPNGVTI